MTKINSAKLNYKWTKFILVLEVLGTSYGIDIGKPKGEIISYKSRPVAIILLTKTSGYLTIVGIRGFLANQQ